MSDDGVRDEISRLEARIEELAATIEGCRKFVLASQAAMAVGALSILAMVLGLIRFDPLVMIGGLTAVIGGAVSYGANTSTSEQATAEMRAAEAQRAALISEIDLRLVGGQDASRPRYLN